MKNVLLILTFIYILVFSFFLFPKNLDKSTYHPPKKFDLTNFIQQQIGDETYEKYELNDQFISITTSKDTILIDQLSGKVASLADLFSSKYDKFTRIINEQLKLKYPEFIANYLINNKVQAKYEFSDSGLKIKFYNYQIEPMPSEDLNIILTCQTLKNLTDINCSTNLPEDINVPKLDPSKPTIALTFDDGPNKNTPIVINALKANKMQATFFMLGQNMNNYPETVKEIYQSGFEIGSHTYSHRYLTKLNMQQRIEELQKTNAIYNSLTGDNIKLTRAPYGSTNKEIRENLNTTFIQWSVDTRDWELRDAQKIVEKTLNDIQDGDIVLMHDIHLTTGKSLEQLLPILYAKGYQVTTVSNLAKLKEKNIEINTMYYSFKN